jgi:ubiquinone/menaquinone biosynthesis C-methylase UbiE
VFKLIRVALAVALAGWVARQVRRPRGALGRNTVRAMNQRHGPVTEWGLSHLSVPRNAAILDIGCGGGATLRRLSALAPEGRTAGVDISAASLAVARTEAGSAVFARASAAALPFPDATFDVITAVETHYYWPDLPANIREVLRVLKPGATFALIAETYRDGPRGLLYSLTMPLLGAALLTSAQHRDLLSQAGFADVKTAHIPGKDWICVTGRKP